MKNDYLDLTFYTTLESIISNERYQQLKLFPHHYSTTIYQHNIRVAKLAYTLARKLHWKVDYPSLTKGALLHDYFFYNWRDKNKGFHWHGYKHAKISRNNALVDFPLNKIEEDIIFKHMFPLNLFRFPKYKETWLVVIADKIVAIQEVLATWFSFGKST